MADFILAGDFRKGITFVMDGNKVMTIVDFLHVKPGKGAAFVRTKLRNVITGGVIEMTFNPTEKFPTAHIERKPMTYSYQDGDLYYFMDQETFDMIPLNKDAVEEALQFVPENGEATASRASRATRPRARPSPRLWRRAIRSKCRCLSTKETQSASILVPERICREFETIIAKKFAAPQGAVIFFE